MRKRILAYGRLGDDQLAQLGHNFEAQTFSGLASAGDASFRAALPKDHGLIGANLAITPELLDAVPKFDLITHTAQPASAAGRAWAASSALP